MLHTFQRRRIIAEADITIAAANDTIAESGKMITALASDYWSVYYLELDRDWGVCYQSHSDLGGSGFKVGEEFPYLAAVTAYAKQYVTAEYLDEKVIVAKRTLDKRMLELNKQGFLNGHTPFSAMAAFSCILTGYLYGLPYAALSNESSANESTVAGSTVNHQYSKSFKFEEDFTAYERKYIGSGVLYFSLLRPWSEYQIAREFAKHPKYHKIFRSCKAYRENNFRINIFCM